MKQIKLMLFSGLIVLSGATIAAPFLVSDQTLQEVTHCGFILDSAAKIDVSVVSVAGGKICKIDLQSVTVGNHTVKLTFVNIDPVWGRAESVESSPFLLTRPSSSVTNTPTGLAIIP